MDEFKKLRIKTNEYFTNLGFKEVMHWSTQYMVFTKQDDEMENCSIEVEFDLDRKTYVVLHVNNSLQEDDANRYHCYTVDMKLNNAIQETLKILGWI